MRAWINSTLVGVGETTKVYSIAGHEMLKLLYSDASTSNNTYMLSEAGAYPTTAAAFEIKGLGVAYGIPHGTDMRSYTLP